MIHFLLGRGVFSISKSIGFLFLLQLPLTGALQNELMTRNDPTAPPSKRRRFNSNWTEGCTWLKHDQDNSVMFCEWC